jgi:uncharacterized phiE125 gp8 family phage protein
MVYYTLPIQRAWTYTVITAADKCPVSLDDIKAYLKITNTSQDDELLTILKAATGIAEKMSNRDFITKTYRTFRDTFSDFEGGSSIGLEIRKSPLQSIEAFQYLVDDVWADVASTVYYNTVEDDYSGIYLVDGQSWPTGGDVRRQSVRIDFKAGYGDNQTDIPNDIAQAIKSHVLNYFVNRGDCSLSQALPEISKNIYYQYRIFESILS